MRPRFKLLISLISVNSSFIEINILLSKNVPFEATYRTYVRPPKLMEMVEMVSDTFSWPPSLPHGEFRSELLNHPLGPFWDAKGLILADGCSHFLLSEQGLTLLTRSGK